MCIFGTCDLKGVIFIVIILLLYLIVCCLFVLGFIYFLKIFVNCCLDGFGVTQVLESRGWGVERG